MKKRLFINKPEMGKRGQYVYFDDAINTYEFSDGLPVDADKFDDRNLYTTVLSDDVNNIIVNNGLAYPGKGFITIDRMVANNVGTGHKQNNVLFSAYIFDNWAYGTDEDPADNPLTVGFNDFFSKLPTGSKFFEWSIGNLGRSANPPILMEKQSIVQDLNRVDPLEDSFNHSVDSFSTSTAFSASEDGFDISSFIQKGQDQKIYIAIYCRGDDRRGKSFWKWTDKRKKRLHIFQVNADDLFTDDNFGKEQTFHFEYSDATIREGGGGAWWSSEAPAFRIDELQITFNTIPTAPVSPSDLNYMTGSIMTPKSIDLNNFDQSFLELHPHRSIKNLITWDGTNFYDGNTDRRTKLKSNFDPITKIKLSNSHYDFQAYQTSSIDRQYCSAPNEISLDFEISKHYEFDSDLFNDNYHPRDVGYKFFVVSWNDEEDEFVSVENYMDDWPENFYELLQKKEDNLYNFSSIGIPLKHKYLKPGIKTIKSIIFSHTIDGDIQPIRWKFLTSRIYLELPLSQYPDFGQLGGSDYLTIPWPYTTALIGGVDDNSQYRISIQDTLTGGKISEDDLTDEEFLIKDLQNNELGQSIENFDLEQVRYFMTGSYDMHKILGIEDKITTDGTDWNPYTDNALEGGYWNCWNWDKTRSQCFSEESSIGQIFIVDNLHLDIKRDCKLELNTADFNDQSILDTSGQGNKGFVIGDYKIKKQRKQQKMRRDSVIKFPNLNDNNDGAL